MKFFPHKAANELTVVLRAAGVASFPVDVRMIALEISQDKYPDDPIAKVRGENIPGFEGGLVAAPPGKKGWGIIYNNAVTSQGRINFTLGHEFGHYLLHRKYYPGGFSCSTEDMARWESEYAQRESEANTFASTLLMPLDDFRAQIDPRASPDFDELGYCANRYAVSLIAATLKWLQYTSRRAMLVVSREGYILWARSSKPAWKSGLYFKTRNRPPIEVPEKSLAANLSSTIESARTLTFDDDSWFRQPGVENIIFSEQYDFTLSLLHFAGRDSRNVDREGESDEVTNYMPR